MDLSYCVVNTNGRELLLACLAAIVEHAPAGIESEVLVVDNASDDGSAAAVEAWNAGPDGLGSRLRLLRRERREGKAALDSLLLSEARGELCLLLNEDTELRAGAVEALVEALRADPGAGAAGAQLVDPAGRPQPCAWRLPGPWRRARERALPASVAGGRERRPGAARGRLGAVRGDARPPRGGRGGRLPGPRLLRLLGRDRLRQAPSRRGLARAARPRRRRRPPRAARDRCRRRPSPRGRVLPRARPLPAQALRRGRGAGAAAADRASLRAARRGGARAARHTTPGSTPSTRARPSRPAAARVCARAPRPTTPPGRGGPERTRAPRTRPPSPDGARRRARCSGT